MSNSPYSINTRFYFWSLLFLLIDFRVFLGGLPVFNLLNIGLLAWGCVIFGFAYKGEVYINLPVLHSKRSIWITATFLFIFSVSLFRSNSYLESNFGAIIMTLKVFFILLFQLFYFDFYYPSKEGTSREDFAKIVQRVILTICGAIGLYLLMNLLSFFVMPLQKLEGVDQDVGLISGLLGLSFPRAGFPFSGGGHPVSIGLLAAGLMVMLVAYLLYDKSRGGQTFLLTMLGLFTSFLVIVITDSRSIFLNAILVMVAFWVLKRIRKVQLILVFVFILPFSQLIMINTLKAVSDTSWGSQFSRSKNELKTGNSRGYIYELSFKELENFKLSHMFGYGEYGPLKVGFVKRYIHFFELGRDKLSKEEAITISISHNASLQVIFDSGYIGLLFFLGLVYASLKSSIQLYNSGVKSGIIPAHFILSYAISGISETTYGRYSSTYFLCFLFIAISTILLNNWRLRNVDKLESG